MHFRASRASLAVASTALAGCILPIAADGGFSVEGRIAVASRSPATCELQLFQDTLSSKPLYSRTVAGVFREGFVVAPKDSTYRLTLLCAEGVVQVVQVRYGTEVRPGATVHLSEVQL